MYKKHSDEKKFICPICSIGYKGSNSLIMHIYSVHEKLELKCPVPNCSSVFHRKDYLRGHIKRIHTSGYGPAELDSFDKIAKAMKVPNLTTFYKKHNMTKRLGRYYHHKDGIAD